MSLMTLLTIVVLADVATTIYALQKFEGRLGEANPALAWLIDEIGLVAAMVLSHFGLLMLMFWLKPAAWAMWIVIAAFGGVSLNNLRLILKKSRR